MSFISLKHQHNNIILYCMISTILQYVCMYSTLTEYISNKTFLLSNNHYIHIHIRLQFNFLLFRFNRKRSGYFEYSTETKNTIHIDFNDKWFYIILVNTYWHVVHMGLNLQKTAMYKGRNYVLTIIWESMLVYSLDKHTEHT